MFLSISSILIVLILIPTGQGSDIDEKLEKIIHGQERIVNECDSRSGAMQKSIEDMQVSLYLMGEFYVETSIVDTL